MESREDMWIENKYYGISENVLLLFIIFFVELIVSILKTIQILRKYIIVFVYLHDKFV